MTLVQHSTKAFDPKGIAQSVFKSRLRDHEHWRNHLLSLSEEQRGYIQKEFLQRYPAEQFDSWFGLPAMVMHLQRDPLLASLHNPHLWLYALTKAYPSAASSCSVLHAYWSSIALMRPSQYFEPQLLANIHGAVAQTVRFLDSIEHPWTQGLTPAVLSCSEEVSMLNMPWKKALQAAAAYTLTYRDLDCLQSMPIGYPVLTVLTCIMETGCFPDRYQTDPHPWPTPAPGVAWTDDLLLSLHAVASHPHLRHWWVLPKDAPALPAHLTDAALVLDIGIQLNCVVQAKTWIQSHESI